MINQSNFDNLLNLKELIILTCLMAIDRRSKNILFPKLI